MGLMDRMKKAVIAFLEDDAEEQRPVPKSFRFTKNMADKYCKLRQKVEEGEIDEYDDRYEQFKRLENNIRSEGHDVDRIYEKFISPRQFLTEEEREDLDDAEDFLRQDDEIKEEVRHVVIEKGVPFVKDREVDRTGYDGTIEKIKITNIPVAACGKKLSSPDDIAGFCSVCGKGLCSEHEEYCAGFGSSRCNKLLCPDHVYLFKDGDDAFPCCDQHYKLRTYFDEGLYLLDTSDDPDHPRHKKNDTEEE